ncbi:MAG TPA: sulfhydrogenase 1 subunit delta [Thermoplasmatales archaeon]|nr:sulfhydrogenase 1 subunit delta [Candidatus Thermoplasmatota archaeon]HDS59359.1 sulfhydrogenase 1 subunit delta [Thermoplasmatales archaeon]
MKIGIHGLTSCYGCQLSMAIVRRLLDVVDKFEVEYFYMLSSKGDIADVDVAFVEGSVSTDMDEEEVKKIREHAKVLVAVGSCAIHGGVQSILHNEGIDYDQAFATVYGDRPIHYRGRVAEPIDKYVQVDYRLPGCPPEEEEIMYYLSTFAIGSWPEEKDYPVCAECRRAGNPCILIERNEPCLGPVTVAGCDARCIKYDIPCIGCRGAVPHDTAWFDSLAKTFKDRGMDKEYVRKRMAIFSAHHGKLDEMLDAIYGD